MRKKKIFRKLIVATLAVGAMNFSPIIFHAENNLQIISVARAEVQTYTASDTAIFDFGEDDEKIVNTVKNVARMRAVQAAKEKAGVYVKSFSKTVNGVLTDDDIAAYTSNNIEILSVTYKKVPVQAHDVRGNDTGKIAFMYEATVNAKIDTAGLAAYVKRDEQEKIAIVQQNNDSRKNVEKISNDFDNLRNSSENKNSEQIKAEVQKIDNEVLAQQKLEEGNKFFEQGKYQDAISKYDEAIKLNPKFAMAYNNRASTCGKLKNYTQAISDFNQALKLNPDEAETYYNRGLTYYHLKNYKQAVSDCNQAIKLNPNYAEAYNNRGISYANLKNYTQAISDFTQAIKSNPNYAIAYNNRGSANALLGNYSQAIKDYTQAIKLNPNYADAYNNRGNCYKELGDETKAQADFAKAKQLGWKG